MLFLPIGGGGVSDSGKKMYKSSCHLCATTLITNATRTRRNLPSKIPKKSSTIILRRQHSKIPTFQVLVPHIKDEEEKFIVSELVVNIGQFVDKDDTVAMIESKNYTCDVRAADSGWVRQVFVKEGEPVKIGDALVEISCAVTTAGDNSYFATGAEEKKKRYSYLKWSAFSLFLGLIAYAVFLRK